jgi:hypothetical protein
MEPPGWILAQQQQAETCTCFYCVIDVKSSLSGFGNACGLELNASKKSWMFSFDSDIHGGGAESFSFLPLDDAVDGPSLSRSFLLVRADYEHVR